VPSAVPLGVGTSHDEQQANKHHERHDEFVSSCMGQHHAEGVVDAA